MRWLGGGYLDEGPEYVTLHNVRIAVTNAILENDIDEEIAANINWISGSTGGVDPDDITQAIFKNYLDSANSTIETHATTLLPLPEGSLTDLLRDNAHMYDGNPYDQNDLAQVLAHYLPVEGRADVDIQYIVDNPQQFFLDEATIAAFEEAGVVLPEQSAPAVVTNVDLEAMRRVDEALQQTVNDLAGTPFDLSDPNVAISENYETTILGIANEAYNAGFVTELNLNREFTSLQELVEAAQLIADDNSIAFDGISAVQASIEQQAQSADVPEPSADADATEAPEAEPEWSADQQAEFDTLLEVLNTDVTRDPIIALDGDITVADYDAFVDAIEDMRDNPTVILGLDTVDAEQDVFTLITTNADLLEVDSPTAALLLTGALPDGVTLADGQFVFGAEGESIFDWADAVHASRANDGMITIPPLEFDVLSDVEAIAAEIASQPSEETPPEDLPQPDLSPLLIAQIDLLLVTLYTNRDALMAAGEFMNEQEYDDFVTFVTDVRNLNPDNAEALAFVEGLNPATTSILAGFSTNTPESIRQSDTVSFLFDGRGPDGTAVFEGFTGMYYSINSALSEAGHSITNEADIDDFQAPDLSSVLVQAEEVVVAQVSDVTPEAAPTPAELNTQAVDAIVQALNTLQGSDNSTLAVFENDALYAAFDAYESVYGADSIEDFPFGGYTELMDFLEDQLGVDSDALSAYNQTLSGLETSLEAEAEVTDEVVVDGAETSAIPANNTDDEMEVDDAGGSPGTDGVDRDAQLAALVEAVIASTAEGSYQRTVLTQALLSESEFMMGGATFAPFSDLVTANPDATAEALIESRLMTLAGFGQSGVTDTLLTYDGNTLTRTPPHTRLLDSTFVARYVDAEFGAELYALVAQQTAQAAGALPIAAGGLDAAELDELIPDPELRTVDGASASLEHPLAIEGFRFLSPEGETLTPLAEMLYAMATPGSDYFSSSIAAANLYTANAHIHADGGTVLNNGGNGGPDQYTQLFTDAAYADYQYDGIQYILANFDQGPGADPLSAAQLEEILFGAAPEFGRSLNGPFSPDSLVGRMSEREGELINTPVISAGVALNMLENYEQLLPEIQEYAQNQAVAAASGIELVVVDGAAPDGAGQSVPNELPANGLTSPAA